MYAPFSKASVAFTVGYKATLSAIISYALFASPSDVKIPKYELCIRYNLMGVGSDLGMSETR